MNAPLYIAHICKSCIGTTEHKLQATRPLQYVCSQCSKVMEPKADETLVPSAGPGPIKFPEPIQALKDENANMRRRLAAALDKIDQLEAERPIVPEPAVAEATAIPDDQLEAVRGLLYAWDGAASSALSGTNSVAITREIFNGVVEARSKVVL